MNNSLKDIRSKIHKHLRDSQILDALKSLNELVSIADKYDIANEYDKLYTSYKYMLEYFVKGLNDPQREKLLKNIMSSIYDLTDKAYVECETKESSHLFYIRRNNRIEDLDKALNDYKDANDNVSLASSVDADANKKSLIAKYETRERHERDIFHYVWTSFPSQASDITLIGDVLSADSAYPSYFKTMIVGALFLSTLQFYEEPKLMLMLDVYADYSLSKNDEEYALAIKSLESAVICLYRHNRKSSLSTEINQRIGILSEMEYFQEDLHNIYLSLVQAKNTDKVSRALQDNILPDIMKIAPDIMDKIKKDDGVIDLSSLEENPEWKDAFDMSGVSKKIEEFSKMQTSGSDVFMSTFAHLKTFPFFRDLYNWFRPYHFDNSFLASTFDKSSDSVKSVIDSSSYLCDSDKYSFALSMSALQGDQRDMMMNPFDSQLREFKEAESSKLPDPSKLRADVVSRFTKDLYRFFKLFTRRIEFADIFKSNLELLDIKLLNTYFNNPELITSIAEIYFNNKQYDSAIEYYNYLLDNSTNVNPINLQKLAFAYQNLGDYKKALKNYLKYSLAKEDDIWNLKHIASCYHALGQHDNAISYLKKALDLSPDNISTNLTLGHYYMEQNELEGALKQYYKVDYLDTKRHSSWRPLAWCLFIKQDFENSRKYYERIFNEDKPTLTDYLNFGHLCIAEGKYEESISYYYNAYTLCNNNLEEFKGKWINDVGSLKLAGVSEDNIPLILDAILLKINETK